MIDDIDITEALVDELIAQQFPAWSRFPAKIVSPGGWDHRTFRLGEKRSARLPSAQCYAAQIEKEYVWLPVLAANLPINIPSPLALGAPDETFPRPWSILRWIDGHAATFQEIPDIDGFAAELASFLVALQKISTKDAPAPGPHNFLRGAHLSHYSEQTEKAIASLGETIDQAAARDLWNTALTSEWEHEPVWVHGDVAPGNLLIKSGKLTAVIDFGCCAIGDPACDLTITWTGFDGKNRDIFRKIIELDEQTWSRARGWALWKALLILNSESEPKLGERSAEDVVRLVLAEHKDHKV